MATVSPHAHAHDPTCVTPWPNHFRLNATASVDTAHVTGAPASPSRCGRRCRPSTPFGLAGMATALREPTPMAPYAVARPERLTTIHEGRLMTVVNVHARRFALDCLPRLRGLLDGLSQRNDPLWPHEVWPAMRFDRPLSVGADGGHGPVRYAVAQYTPGHQIVFRFKAPSGFDGTHRFEVLQHAEDVELRHTLRMEVTGPAVLSWPLAFRPMHDALLEDCMAKAQIAMGDPPQVVPWPLPVRLLRFLIAHGRPRPQRLLHGVQYKSM